MTTPTNQPNERKWPLEIEKAIVKARIDVFREWSANRDRHRYLNDLWHLDLQRLKELEKIK